MSGHLKASVKITKASSRLRRHRQVREGIVKIMRHMQAETIFPNKSEASL